MANFLKVNAGPVAGDGIETLIPIGNIGAIASVANAAGVTTIVIQMANFQTAGTYTITVPGVVAGTATAASREKDATDALNAALTANPGGVVSTLGAVPALLQTPAAQSGAQGRIAIAQAATFAQYSTCTYAV
tara:strand:- start:1051 stop:1449 length:399 start_codon:yes stop_codon:yes gene_type:complete